MKLRNGKGGSFGTGELVKLSGREKLEILAAVSDSEDEMDKAKEAKKKTIIEASLRSSVRAPFNMEISTKIAQSQMDAYIDHINALHKNEICYDIANRRGIKDPDPITNPAFVAEQFAICVHNGYMLASGWTIVYESLRYMRDMGLTDRMVLGQLKSSSKLRSVYLLAYELLQKLVSVGQQRLRSIVRNTEHYHAYFRVSSESKDRQEFDHGEIRRMYKSFLDSTIIELCLPGSQFTPQSLYACLNAIESESKKDLKRCPQIMWDAVGDLAEAVRLLDLIETPLLNAEGDLRLGDDPEKPLEFALWDEAQAVSVQAALQYSGFVNLVHPLTNLKKKLTLEKAWDRINANYVRETGKNIDALWQLVDVRRRIPQFSVVTLPKGAFDEKGGNKVLVRGGGKQEQLKITANGEEESGDSMPGLLDVSNSDEEERDEDSTSEYSSYVSEDDDSSANDDDDEAYDTEEEEELRKMHRDAMNVVNEMPDILNNENGDKYAKERKKNPFLKLLGNLKGRMFSPSSVLRTDGKTTITSRPTAPKAQAPKKPTTASKLDDDNDESDEPKGDKKKKKKSKKKKKKVASAPESADLPVVETSVSSAPAPAPPLSPTPSPAREPASSSPPASPSKVKSEAKKPASKAPSVKAPSITSNISGTTAFGSTTSLPLPAEQKAESARAYLAKLAEAKTKVKTRPDQQLDTESEKGRTRLFSKFGSSKEKPKEDVKQKNTANTGTMARKLFGVSAQDKKGALKWEQFLQIMRELGFEYDPSTAGSSVRFDPPNPNDRVRTLKTHPDPTLHQNMLKQYRDKLESYYGWSPEKFQRAMDGIGGMSSDDHEID
ncbi:hypothetical protein DFH11DRAFT_1686181 [Phellopilus nigrolimitatus]|nr:hypothetical protein DFH11DRAFT_1686181 [Phellopilus nigrolimitatus]